MLVPALLDNQQQQQQQRRSKFPSHHSRQLLSIALAGADDDDDASDDVSANASSSSSTDDYWIDDVVRSYKQETLQRVLDLFRSTQSNSLQRILRRKLKEELGFRVPLYPAAPTTAGRTSRISASSSSLAAAPRYRAHRHRPTIAATTYDSLVAERHSAAATPRRPTAQQVEVDMPPSPPTPIEDEEAENSNRQRALPCTSVDDDDSGGGGLNETESSELLKSKLDWWISTHEVNRRIKSKQQQQDQNKEEFEDDAVASTRMKFRRRGRRSRINSKNKVALFSKADRDMRMFWKAFGRRNDTYYVVDLKQDQIILPPLVRDLSSKTRLSLLFSAAPPNGEEQQEQQEGDGEGHVVNMIKIECEVNSSEYLKIRKDLFPRAYHGYQQQQGNEQHIVSRGEVESGGP